MEHVQREYRTLHGRVSVLRDVDFEIMPGEKVGIIGKNGAGKSTMIRLISGAEHPNSGKITRTMSVSWPLAFSGGFQGTLTGLDNLRFICRIYGKDWRDEVPFIDDFTELGRYLREPVSTYSSGMRSRLAFALSMVIDFDCFLIDEVMAVGDHRFHERCDEELFGKRGHKAMIFVSHDPGFIRTRCERASVLKDGVLHNFSDLDHAFHYYYSEAIPPLAKVDASKDAKVETNTSIQSIDLLLFGRFVPEAQDHVGVSFAKWVFSHPLNADPAVARHRLDTKVEESGLALLAQSFTTPLSSDYSWRSVHSALAAYADDRKDCAEARQFLDTFEAGIPIEHAGGLWEKMAAEGGSIYRMKTFEHVPSGRILPVRVNFFRPATEDHVRNELAEFCISDQGVTCTLQICHQEIYAVRLFAAYPFLLKYFETCELDGEFGLSLGDEGLDERVLSFCARVPSYLVPDIMFISTGGYSEAREKYGAGLPWAEREDKAYWRGTDTGVFRYREFTQAPRVVIAQLANDHPALIDAKLTQVELRPGWESKRAHYTDHGLMGNPDPQDRILDFKYQIDVDGNTNSWPGLFLKLLTGSPVLKVESELGFRQWYYDLLEPWQNYVPVASDASDLLEKLEWLRQNPAEAEAIGRNGRAFALSQDYDSVLNAAVQTVRVLVQTNRRLNGK